MEERGKGGWMAKGEIYEKKKKKKDGKRVEKKEVIKEDYEGGREGL